MAANGDKQGATRVCAIALALWVGAACHPATAQGGADPCAVPPTWPQPGAAPGPIDAEMAACLKDKAYQARTVRVPTQSKVAGIMAQCEVEIDRRAGAAMAFSGAGGSDPARQGAEQRAEQEAAAAVAAYQSCPGR